MFNLIEIWEASRLRHSIQIKPELVEQLGTAESVCLAASGLVASLTLGAWFIPSLANSLPSFWSVTKANTAFIALATTIGLGFSHPQRSTLVGLLRRMLVISVGLITIGVLIEYIFHASFHFELLLPYDHTSPTLGRMAPPTAINFCLLSIVAVLITQRDKILAAVADIAVSVLAVSVTINAAGWVFGAARLFGISGNNKVGPSTMVCLLLLTFVAFARRAEYGFFCILLGSGPGSSIARTAVPIALLVPFMLETARALSVHYHRISPEYASAVSTTLAVLLAFGLILVLAWRMLSLEREIIDLSLRDELTELYNRRGFFMMAEQALWLARRTGLRFFVIYIDLDGLKIINDSRGHDKGSDFIREAADLLKQVFRRTDIVGRVGGDEFVVAGQCDKEHVTVIVDRLRAVAEEQNNQIGRDYPFSLSHGLALSISSESLQELVKQADLAMYETKFLKKSQKGMAEWQSG